MPCRIFTYDIVTGERSLVHTSTSVHFEAPNWTAADMLIVNGDGLLWALPADGTGEPRRIPLHGIPEINNDHVLAPGHETIYLSANDGHLYRAPLAGGTARRITFDDTRRHFLHGVSPDGTRLAYVGVDRPDWSTASLLTVGVDGTGTTRVTPVGGVDDGPEYTPDGAWLHFNTERFSPGHAQIARIRPDGSDLQQLTDDERVNWFPHFAPDGRHAVHLSYPPGTRGHPGDLPVELRLVEGDDWRSPRTVVALHGGQGTINVNSWSTDSRRFAYVDYPATR